MEEKFEYKFRGLGVLTLCALLFAVGVWRFGGGAQPVSGAAGAKELPICSVDTQKKQISLTFDAKGSGGDTQKILDILKECHVRASFFVTEEWAEKYPESVKAIVSGGHDLGQYSRGMNGRTDKQCRQQLQNTQEKIKELTGYQMFLFRMPNSAYDYRMAVNARACGYYQIQWNIDSLDWKDYGVEEITRTVLESRRLGNGSLIQCRSGARYTAESLKPLIEGLQEKGFALVPVSELIYREDYHIDSQGRQVPAAK